MLSDFPYRSQGNISEQYQQNVKRKIDAYKQQTARQKYGDHKGYSDFKEDIWVGW